MQHAFRTVRLSGKNDGFAGRGLASVKSPALNTVAGTVAGEAPIRTPDRRSRGNRNRFVDDLKSPLRPVRRKLQFSKVAGETPGLAFGVQLSKKADRFLNARARFVEFAKLDEHPGAVLQSPRDSLIIRKQQHGA